MAMIWEGKGLSAVHPTTAHTHGSGKPRSLPHPTGDVMGQQGGPPEREAQGC